MKEPKFRRLTKKEARELVEETRAEYGTLSKAELERQYRRSLKEPRER